MVEKIVWTKKTIEDKISSLQIYFNKIVNETHEGIDVKVLDALLIEKIYLFVNQLQIIQRSLSLNGEVDSKIQDKLNFQYQDILNVQNNSYSKQNSVHKDLYELILKTNDLYFFLQNDFLVSYNSIVDLILKQDSTSISHRDDILREFNLLHKKLKEIDEILNKVIFHQDLRIDVFYNYVKHYILKDKDKLISLDLLEIFYGTFINNKAINLKNTIASLELLIPKFTNIRILTLENVIDFIQVNNDYISFLIKLFRFKVSFNLDERENKLLESRYISKIQSTFEMIYHKLTEITELNLKIRNHIQDDLNKFVLHLKKREFNNIELGLITVKASYYLLNSYIGDLRTELKNLDKIMVNFSSSLEFLQYSLSEIETKLKKVENILDSNDEVRNIVIKYYFEMKSNGFKKLENSIFEVPDEVEKPVQKIVEPIKLEPIKPASPHVNPIPVADLNQFQAVLAEEDREAAEKVGFFARFKKKIWKDKTSPTEDSLDENDLDLGAFLHSGDSTIKREVPTPKVSNENVEPLKTVPSDKGDEFILSEDPIERDVKGDNPVASRPIPEPSSKNNDSSRNSSLIGQLDTIVTDLKSSSLSDMEIFGTLGEDFSNFINVNIIQIKDITSKRLVTEEVVTSYRKLRDFIKYVKMYILEFKPNEIRNSFQDIYSSYFGLGKDLVVTKDSVYQLMKLNSKKVEVEIEVNDEGKYTQLARDYVNRYLGEKRINFENFKGSIDEKRKLKEIVNGYGRSIKSFKGLPLFLRLIGIRTVNNLLDAESFNLIRENFSNYLSNNNLDLDIHYDNPDLVALDKNIILFIELLVLKVETNIDISKLNFKDDFREIEGPFEKEYKKILQELSKI